MNKWVRIAKSKGNPICAKTMFSSFVTNSRNMNAMTAGRINFMMKSVIEVYRDDLDEAYRHAFVFIRQLAIILRKAYASSKDHQSIHNWQFINSLKLWSDFVVKYGDINQQISTLRHPLVNIIIGSVRLAPSERFIPLRFHCVSMLHALSGGINMENDSNDAISAKTIFIPTIPLILDVFSIVDFNKSATRHSKTPFDLRLLLHYSPSQRAEASCPEATLEWMTDLLWDALFLHATSPAFPDLSYPVLNALHSFVKKCKNAKYTQLLKKINNAITDQVKFITKERTSLRNITDTRALENFRVRIATSLADQSPFAKLYADHRTERRKYLQQLAETKKKHTEQGEKDEESNEKRADEKTSKKRKKLPDNQESSSEESDASYDYDDGKQVVHVSRDERKKQKMRSEDSDDASDDFDLEAALEETQPDEDDAVSIATTQDQEDDDLSDFDIDEYGEDKGVPKKRKKSGKATPKAKKEKKKINKKPKAKKLKQSS
ncbi:Nucleolar complex protein 2 [Cichlidogyrus casuarinus]|uniref:Nucleolar complex protein 2 n=1 Tax=Cichlidogyrus casuarinus TaxID=1844966 RepID=A0ABD2QNK3_9PLAT